MATLHLPAIPQHLALYLTPPTNYIGTVLFLSYILAALYLTTSILLTSVLPRCTRHLSPRSKAHALFAFTSFCTLSATMVSVLVSSYFAYHSHAGVRPSLRGIWAWMTHSSLFYEFARELRGSGGVVAWTRQGLFMTMVLGLEMGRVGRAYRVESLWRFFAMGQILPPVCAYHLLALVASLEGEEKKSEAKGQKSEARHAPAAGGSQPLLAISVIAIEAYSVFNLRPMATHESPRLAICKILLLRVFLLAPLLGDMSMLFKSQAGTAIKVILIGLAQYWIVSKLFEVVMGRATLLQLFNFVATGFSNPPVRVLTVDWIIWNVGMLYFGLG